MNKRRFLQGMAAAGVAIGTPLLAKSAMVQGDNYVINNGDSITFTMGDCPIGTVTTIIKTGEFEFIVYGDNVI